MRLLKSFWVFCSAGEDQIWWMYRTVINRVISLYMTRFQSVKNAAMAFECLFPNLDSTPLSTLETLGQDSLFLVPQFPHCITDEDSHEHCAGVAGRTHTAQDFGPPTDSRLINWVSLSDSDPTISGHLILPLPGGEYRNHHTDTLLLLWGCFGLWRLMPW